MTDYIVKDLALAKFGRKELNIAETVMPDLMACRSEFGNSKTLKDMAIVGNIWFITEGPFTPKHYRY